MFGAVFCAVSCRVFEGSASFLGLFWIWCGAEGGWSSLIAEKTTFLALFLEIESNLCNKNLWTKLAQPQNGLLGNWSAHFDEIRNIWSTIFPSFSIQVLGPKKANYRSTSAKTNHLRRNLTKKAPYRLPEAKSEPVRLDLKREFLAFSRTVWGHKKCNFGRSPDLHITITRSGAPFFISGTKTGPQQSQNRLLEQHLNYFAQNPSSYHLQNSHFWQFTYN